MKEKKRKEEETSAGKGMLGDVDSCNSNTSSDIEKVKL